jgi:glutathione synthase/RimK-type ligase-like ATP-grasp enzyme
MVIIWGLAEDRPLEVVRHHLRELGTDTAFIDQRRVAEYTIDLKIDSTLFGSLVGPGVSLDLSQATAAYLRQYNFEQLDTFEGVARGSELWTQAAQFEDTLNMWSELTGATIVNRPSAMGSNSSKPYQLDIIRRMGFAVPDTLITTDPDCVVAFWRRHQRIIYKSISSCRSIVAQFTNRDLATVEDVMACPTQFQQFIDGTDYRVHVLDERVVASRIVCSDDDYRYSDRARVEPAILPDDVSERCVSLNRGLGLRFSGVDLRHSSDGEWYCFEVNPSPGFTYFETGALSIGRELARFLSRA